MAVFQSIRKFFSPGLLPALEMSVEPAAPTTYSIKPLTSQHSREVLELNLRCFRDGENYTKHTFNYLFNEPSALSYQTVTAEEEMAGFIFLLLNKDGAAHITTIGVAPEHRRRGLALKMLDHTEAVLKTKGISTTVLEVRVSNTSAILLYRSAGYMTVNRIPAYYSDGEDCFMMVKSLT